MKKTQEDKLSMYYAVQKICNASNGIWNTLPAYVSAFAEFSANLSKLTGVLEMQVKQIKGVSKDKAALRQSMTDKALEIGNAVFAYAADKNNSTLKGKVNFSATGLKRERDTIFIQHCQRIKDEASTVINDLGNYGVSSADVDTLQTNINDFTAAISLPRAAITERKGATSSLEVLISGIDEVLKNKMDRLMDKFKATSSEFYNQYFDVRSIVSQGVRHKKSEPPPVAGK